MGIDIDSKFLVGLWYDDFPEDILEKLSNEGFDIDEKFDNIETASPYYDCPKYERFYGYSIQSGLNVGETEAKLREAAAMFYKTFKVQPFVYAGKDVW